MVAVTGLLGAFFLFCGVKVYTFTRSETTLVADRTGVAKEAAMSIAPTPSEYIVVSDIDKTEKSVFSSYGVPTNVGLSAQTPSETSYLARWKNEPIGVGSSSAGEFSNLLFSGISVPLISDFARHFWSGVDVDSRT
ncbi:MAG: hypothetical protein WAK13_19630, partial [Terriglobales bacterium]